MPVRSRPTLRERAREDIERRGVEIGWDRRLCGER